MAVNGLNMMNIGAVNTQGFVWKFFLCAIYKFSFIHSFNKVRSRFPKVDNDVE